MSICNFCLLSLLLTVIVVVWVVSYALSHSLLLLLCIGVVLVTMVPQLSCFDFRCVVTWVVRAIFRQASQMALLSISCVSLAVPCNSRQLCFLLACIRPGLAQMAAILAVCVAVWHVAGDWLLMAVLAQWAVTHAMLYAVDALKNRYVLHIAVAGLWLFVLVQLLRALLDLSVQAIVVVLQELVDVRA